LNLFLEHLYQSMTPGQQSATSGEPESDMERREAAVFVDSEV
jgi:hypothetical protein